jgi:hypothetical protein
MVWTETTERGGRGGGPTEICLTLGWTHTHTHTYTSTLNRKMQAAMIERNVAVTTTTAVTTHLVDLSI